MSSAPATAPPPAGVSNTTSSALASGALSAVPVLLKQLHRLATQRHSDTQALLNDYLETGCKLFGLPTGLVSRIEGAAYTVRAAWSSAGAYAVGTRFDLADTYCALVVRERRVLAHACADDALGHPAYTEPKLAAYISAPIWVDGDLYGTLNFSGVEPRPCPFMPHEREIIEVMAATIGRFFERGREEAARRQAEAALRRSEARYKQLVEQANDVIYRADAEGFFTYANPVALRLTGYTEDEVLGMHFLSLVRPDHREDAAAFYLRQIREEAPNTYYEFPITTRDGRTAWLGQHVQLRQDAAGDVAGVQAVARDITDRKKAEAAREQAEAALRRSEALLNQTNAIARVGGWEYDLETETLFWTDEVYRIHRVPDGYEPTVEDALRFYPPEARNTLEAALDRAVEEGVPYDLELAFITATGRRRWVRAIGEPQQHNGQTVRLTGTFQDITERKQAEHALRGERQFLNAVLENMRAGVVACGADGALTLVNRAMREMHGLHDAPLNAADWDDHYTLLRTDGVTPLPLEEMPLIRAFHGEHVNGAELVVAPARQALRTVEVSGQSLHDDEGRKLGAVVVMHDVTARKTLEERLYHHAHHDALTGLPNLKQFVECCHDAIGAYEAEGTPYAVLFLDLDRFKSVNDSLGHHAGDALLRAVARRVRACLCADDLVARLGGDEFGLLLRSRRAAANAGRIAERLARALEEPFELGGCPVRTAASIGIVQGGARHETPEDLMREADTAMYRAKRQGCGPALFNPAMGEEVKTQFHLEADLHRALENDELRVFFQPVVALSDGALTGFEALVRWQHPERGLLTPAAFIGVAEEAGLVPGVDRWVIRAACQQARRWRDRFGDGPPLLLNVNCSHRTFLQSSLFAYVEEMLAEADLAPTQLAIEITERTLIEDMDAAVAEMQRFKARGIHLCIDDFGVEYSSLGALQQLPVDTLKVDRSFVQRVGATEKSTALVRAIADLAHRLNLSLVAEGIETPEHLSVLRTLGYEHGQGYLLARPLDAGAATQLLQDPCPWRPYWPQS